MNLKLKQLRQAAGISQDEMAAKLTAITGSEVKVSRYGTWERGERMLNLEQAYNCAIALNCTLNDLVGMEPPDKALTKDEEYIVDTYRAVTSHGKKAMLSNTRAAREDYMPKSDKADVSEVRSA